MRLPSPEQDGRYLMDSRKVLDHSSPLNNPNNLERELIAAGLKTQPIDFAIPPVNPAANLWELGSVINLTPPDIPSPQFAHPARAAIYVTSGQILLEEFARRGPTEEIEDVTFTTHDEGLGLSVTSGNGKERLVIFDPQTQTWIVRSKEEYMNMMTASSIRSDSLTQLTSRSFTRMPAANNRRQDFRQIETPPLQGLVTWLQMIARSQSRMSLGKVHPTSTGYTLEVQCVLPKQEASVEVVNPNSIMTTIHIRVDQTDQQQNIRTILLPTLTSTYPTGLRVEQWVTDANGQKVGVLCTNGTNDYMYTPYYGVTPRNPLRFNK